MLSCIHVCLSVCLCVLFLSLKRSCAPVRMHVRARAHMLDGHGEAWKCSELVCFSDLEKCAKSRLGVQYSRVYEHVLHAYMAAYIKTRGHSAHNDLLAHPCSVHNHIHTRTDGRSTRGPAQRASRGTQRPSEFSPR
jgi:hypothetical protein